MTPVETLLDDLAHRAFFKLIAGGSFSETERLKALMAAYGKAGVSAVDVSANRNVVEAAIEALGTLEKPPALMVSFPLDADPHFRKIELAQDACVSCDACLPVCPTGVFTSGEPLQVETPLCYGCGRCVPICPPQALGLAPFTVHPDLPYVLGLAQVHAVEIHTTHADPVMVDTLYAELGPLLKDKLISVCYRPQTMPVERAVAFLEALLGHTTSPVIVQVDGNPMSGTEAPDCSLPALDAAKAFAPYLPQQCFLTISGGINAHTAEYLKQPEYLPIQGVGMGTAARKAVWSMLSSPHQALHQARIMVKPYHTCKKSVIMPL